MRGFSIAVLFFGVLTACGGGTAKSPATPPNTEPKQYAVRVVAEYPHLRTSYTQGLQYIDGCMWEGTGQHGASRLQRIDLATGRAEVVAELPRAEFGEGIAVLGDEVWQLTWMNNVAHVYDRRTGRLLRNVRYSGEGWGLATDGESLYMSNGTARIVRLDPATFTRRAAITVTLRGEPLEYLNELEWIDGKLWANVYTFDNIVIIDPATGIVEGVVDLRGLLPESERTPETDVLNGIAYDAGQGRIFVTGKNWSKLYQIELIEK